MKNIHNGYHHNSSSGFQQLTPQKFFSLPEEVCIQLSLYFSVFTIFTVMFTNIISVLLQWYAICNRLKQWYSIHSGLPLQKPGVQHVENVQWLTYQLCISVIWSGKIGLELYFTVMYWNKILKCTHRFLFIFVFFFLIFYH